MLPDAIVQKKSFWVLPSPENQELKWSRGPMVSSFLPFFRGLPKVVHNIFLCICFRGAEGGINHFLQSPRVVFPALYS